SAMEWCRRNGSPLTLPLEGFSWLAAAQQQPARALRLAAAAAAALPPEQTIPVRSPTYLAALGRRLEQARATLGAEASAAAWAEGAAMSPEEAVRYALTVEPDESGQRNAPVPASAAAGAGRSPTGDGTVSAMGAKGGSGASKHDRAGGLSPREAEVAALVARGLTNRQIAAELIISERTAARHVEHILGKLGFAKRAQVAAWAVEQASALPG
ncbi:MAG: response regulator transcription factor, partial [Chloroflexota bacterium]